LHIRNPDSRNWKSLPPKDTEITFRLPSTCFFPCLILVAYVPSICYWNALFLPSSLFSYVVL